MTERFHYWSNGTEGHAWAANFCDRCLNDHQMHGPNGEGPGCEIACRIYIEDDHRLIGELIYDEATDGYCGGGVRCISFRKCTKCDPDDPGDDGPKPVDPIPGQELLFDLPEHHLMYRDVLIDEGIITPAQVDA